MNGVFTLELFGQRQICMVFDIAGGVINTHLEDVIIDFIQIVHPGQRRIVICHLFHKGWTACCYICTLCATQHRVCIFDFVDFTQHGVYFFFRYVVGFYHFAFVIDVCTVVADKHHFFSHRAKKSAGTAVVPAGSRQQHNAIVVENVPHLFKILRYASFVVDKCAVQVGGNQFNHSDSPYIVITESIS